MLYEKTWWSIPCIAHLCRTDARLAGQTGICGVRENRDGVLYSLVYGTLIAEHIDPIEKNHSFMFIRPQPYSVATVGCNFNCEFCQNHEISQMPRLLVKPGEDILPAEMCSSGEKSGSKTIAYTYTEPTVLFRIGLRDRENCPWKWFEKCVCHQRLYDSWSNWYDGPFVNCRQCGLKSFRDDFL